MTNGLGNFAPGVPDLAFVAFQLTFAVITPALITGAIADRMRWAAWVGFITLWSILVYLPVAHWIFGGGWLAEPRRARLRRRRGRARERGRRGTGPRDPAREAARLAATPDAAALAAAHVARHRHPVVRLVRLQRRLGARREPRRRAGVPQHVRRGRRGDDRLADRRALEVRSRDDARCRVRCGRRPGRDHAVRRLRRRARADRDRWRSPASSATWRSA